MAAQNYSKTVKISVIREAVALLLAETYPQLKRRAKQVGAMIFFLDEGSTAGADRVNYEG